MYSNDQTQIRAGLVNYIGAMLNASVFDNEQASKHSVVAALLEESAIICKDNEGHYDMYSCKPAFRLVLSIVKQRKAMLDELPETPDVVRQKESYQVIEKELNSLIENIKI